MAQVTSKTAYFICFWFKWDGCTSILSMLNIHSKIFLNNSKFKYSVPFLKVTFMFVRHTYVLR